MWLYENVEYTDPPKHFIGFVYKITNLQSGKKYIGKKLFTSSKRSRKKGRVKRERVESDWRTYYGSNKELLDDVASLGHEHFRREIIHLCTTRGDCSYHEARLQFEHRVLEYPDQFYNTWIMCRIHRKHLPKS